MKHYNARAHNMNLGLFTDLFILGVTAAANQTSDFTDADTSQDFTLATPPAGTIFQNHAVIYTKQTFVDSGGTLTAVATSGGVSAGGTDIFASDSLMMNAVGSATHGVALADGSSTNLFFGGTDIISIRVVTTGANLSTLTAGELWIFLNLIRPADIVSSIDG